ncbi:MAG: ferritin-like domain-containing protein [Alphaproteobacteria bacterium]
MSDFETLCDGCRAVLATANPHAKAQEARKVATAWRAGGLEIGTPHAPDRPARPQTPALMAPKDMPKRSFGGEKGRAALLHALAHIELNAIDLAFDIIARFASPDLPRAFYDDWIKVGDDEARHFLMLSDRLADLNCAYGDLPAHDGLWQSAEDTNCDLLARLAIVPLVHEARGLDVTPQTVERLRRNGDDTSADLLQIIYNDEISHVKAGSDWFHWACEQEGKSPEATFKALVASYFKGLLKPPFNIEGRTQAGLPEIFYSEG